MRLYWCRKFEKSQDSRKLLQMALKDYLTEYSREYSVCLDEEIRIFKEPGGKLYTDISGLYFNISHSQNLWVCGVSNQPVGVDVEFVRHRNYSKLMEKYFDQQEKIYVAKHGVESFFDIWTFKEAYSKLLGESIFRNIRHSAIRDGKIKAWKVLETRNPHENPHIYNINFKMVNGIKGFRCTVAKMFGEEPEEINIELKEINI